MKTNIRNKKLIILVTITIFIVGILLIAIHFSNKINLGIISKINKQNIEKNSSIDATYSVRSTNENQMLVTILFESNIGIKSIKRPDGMIITTNIENKTKLAIDYNIVSGNSYVFKIQLIGEKEEVEYTLNADIDAKPEITQDNSYLYPLMTLYGVKLNKKITIDYGEETNNYYSLDNGETWIKYEGELTVQKEGTILAKSIKDKEIVKLDSEEIKMNLESDALGPNAYDGNEDTFETIERNVYIEIDSSVIGKNIRILHNFETFSVDLLDINKNRITKVSEYRQPEVIFEINDGTKWLKFYNWMGWEKIMEVQIVNKPNFNVEKFYPKITPDGVEKGYNNVTVNYFITSVDKMYSLDGNTWLDYNDTAIKLEIGETIYAKGIDKYGVETPISTYTAVLPSDSLRENAYDGDENTYDEVDHENLYIEVDTSMIGKNVRVLKQGESFSVNLCDENKEVISSIYGYRETDKTFEIIEGTKYLRFTSYRIKEVQPVK